jgi:dolichol-phosphate mannosyltransferase
MKLSIIIPAYNEEKRIKNTLESLVETFNHQCEILVVSEGKDNTNVIVKEFSKKADNVKLINDSKERLGKGGAFKKGAAFSKGEIVVLLDSDLPVPVLDVEKIISFVGEVDVAVASRNVEGTTILVYPPRTRVFAGKAFARLVNFLFNLHVKDTQCGCKAFKKEVLDSVLGSVESDGFEFDAELLFRCKKKGYKIKEVPITWSYKPDSKVSLFKDALKMGHGVFKLWFKTYIVMRKN